MSLVVETRWMTGSILRSTYSERGMNQNDEEPCSNQHSYAVWNPNAGIWLHTRCHIVNHRVYPNIRQFWRTFGSSYGIALVSTWWYQMILRTGPEMGKRHDFPVWFQAEAARDSEDQVLPPRVRGNPTETKAVLGLLGGWKKILHDMLIVRNGMVIPNWLWYMAIGQHYQSSKGIVSYCLNEFNAKKAAF